MCGVTVSEILSLPTLTPIDPVNYSVLSAKIKVCTDKKVIQMDLELDDSISTVMDYFEIFLKRMAMRQKAAQVLGLKFKLIANGSKTCLKVQELFALSEKKFYNVRIAVHLTCYFFRLRQYISLSQLSAHVVLNMIEKTLLKMPCFLKRQMGGYYGEKKHRLE